MSRESYFVPVTIPLGGNVSTPFTPPFGYTIAGVLNDPSGWDAADMQLQVCHDGLFIENLITNGGFETNTTGWTTAGTNTIASSALQFKFGAKSCLVTVGNNAVYMDYSAAAITNEPYTVSAWVFIPTAFDGGGLALKQLNYTVATSQTAANMALRDQWQQLTLTFTPGADVTGNIQIINTGAAATATRTFHVDGVQLEVGQAATTYRETDNVTLSSLPMMFDNAASAVANTIRIVLPTANTFHVFGIGSAAGGPVLFMPVGGLTFRIRSLDNGAGASGLVAKNQTAARTLKVLIFRVG